MTGAHAVPLLSSYKAYLVLSTLFFLGTCAIRVNSNFDNRKDFGPESAKWKQLDLYAVPNLLVAVFQLHPVPQNSSITVILKHLHCPNFEWGQDIARVLGYFCAKPEKLRLVRRQKRRCPPMQAHRGTWQICDNQALTTYLTWLKRSLLNGQDSPWFHIPHLWFEMKLTKQHNPDTRPLPKGWSERYDEEWVFPCIMLKCISDIP